MLRTVPVKELNSSDIQKLVDVQQENAERFKGKIESAEYQDAEAKIDVFRVFTIINSIMYDYHLKKVLNLMMIVKKFNSDKIEKISEKPITFVYTSEEYPTILYNSKKLTLISWKTFIYYSTSAWWYFCNRNSISWPILITGE